MKETTAERRDYWSWLGPLCLASAGVFFGVILGQLTLNQMLYWPNPVMEPAARMVGRFVGSAICAFFPITLTLVVLAARRPGWLPNVLAFFLVGLLAYVYSVFLIGTPPL